MEKTIRVTGKGRMQVKPDTVRLTIRLEGKSREYEEALKISAHETKVVKDIFEDLGFLRDEVKTLLFDVETVYESYKDADGSYRRRHIGYSFTHDVKVEFADDKDLLGSILYNLSRSSVSPEFKIDYTVKNSEEIKNEVMARAVEDSRKKAEILCKASGMTLCGVENIDYSWREINFVTTYMDEMAEPGDMICKSTDCYDMDLSPDDIKVDDTVTIVWGIK